MSQGTPTREGRIERHLMRQRGAGVRTITADFGFSFALPTLHTVEQLQLPIDPPSKRRKTNESRSPRRRSDHSNSVKDAIHPSVSEETCGARHIASQPRGRVKQTSHGDEDTVSTCTLPKDKLSVSLKKQAVRARRKIRLDDDDEEAKQHNGFALKAGDLEDTFIFSPRPTKRQTKRKLEGAVNVHTLNPDPPRKRGRPAKVKPAKVVEEPKEEDEVKKSEDDVVCVEPPRKRGRPRKDKAAAAPTIAKEKEVSKAECQAHDVPVSGDNARPKVVKQKSEVSRRKLMSREQLNMESVNIDEVQQVPVEQLKGTKRGNTFNAARVPDIVTEVLAEIDPGPTNTNSIGIEIVDTEPTSIKPETAKHVIDEVDESGPANIDTAKAKPIRTKAVSKKSTERSDAATTGGGEATNAVMPEKAVKRPKRQAAITAIKKVTLGYEEDLIPVDKLRRAPDVSIKSKRSRKAAPCEPTSAVLSNTSPLRSLIAEKESLGCEEEVPLPAVQPTKRVRKTASKAAKLGDKQKHQELEVTKPCTTEHESSTKKEEPAPGEESSRPKAPTAKRGRKPGAKAAKPDVESVDVEPEAAESERNSRVEQASPDFDPQEVAAKGSNTRSKRKEQDAQTDIVASSVTTTKKQSTNSRRALADFDANIVRKSSVVSTKEKISTKHKHTSHFAQTCQNVAISPSNEPPGGKSSVSKKRHMTSTDEDLDWLFENPETHTKRSRPAVVRHPGTKTRRKEPKHGAKDMDLDDLLASIAGFSGELLTGKRGRAVAS